MQIKHKKKRVTPKLRICIKLFKFRIKDREEVEFFFPKKKSWHRDVFRDSVPCPILLSKAFHHAVRKGMLCLDFDEDTKIYIICGHIAMALLY